MEDRPMSADPLAQIRSHLRHAARIIRRNGLHQGHFYDYDQRDNGTPEDECRVCALGAVNTAVAGSPSSRLSRDDVRAVVNHLNAYAATVLGEVTVPEWNDQDGRTVEQVALLLRRAAAWTPTGPDTLALAA
jgi:hypothetical protein